MLKKFIIATLTLVAAMAPLAAQQMASPAQTPGLKRIPLQKFDIPAGEREDVTTLNEIPPNTDVARHTHPGPEVDYLLDGSLTLTVGNESPKTFKAGDNVLIPENTPHAARSGENGAKVLSTYIVEKGKPLATPAP